MASIRLEADRDFRPLQIYEQVSHQIRAGILEGKFPPESRLPSERELASLFGVGRPAVREAIGALQNEGLVLTKRNSGTYIAAAARARIADFSRSSDLIPPTSDFSPTAALDVRLFLEPEIARRAAAWAHRDSRAEEYLSDMETIKDICDPAQRTLWNESDRLFHRQLAVMTRNFLLIKMADEVAKTMDQLLWKRLKDDGISEPTRIQLYVSEHRLIYEAIVKGDGDAAAFYVQQHIERVGRDIVPR